MFNGLTPAPDRQFVSDLKRFDRKLDVHFDRKYGRFVITQPSKISGRIPALVVNGDNGGGYRQPDMGDIKALYQGDFARKGTSGRDRVRNEENRFKEQEAKHQAFVKDEIMHQTKDNKIQLANTYSKAFNTGKGTTGFRQVPVKSKGYIVKDRRKLQTSGDE